MARANRERDELDAAANVTGEHLGLVIQRTQLYSYARTPSTLLGGKSPDVGMGRGLYQPLSASSHVPSSWRVEPGLYGRAWRLSSVLVAAIFFGLRESARNRACLPTPLTSSSPVRIALSFSLRRDGLMLC